MICPWCKLEFVGRPEKRFCCPEHKDAWHNAKKAFGVILAPRAFRYIQEIAQVQGKTPSEMANIMILRMANADGRPLENGELYGKDAINGVQQP